MENENENDKDKCTTTPFDITLAEAAEMTKRYRDNSPVNAILGYYFSKQAMMDVLNQTLCTGVRIYYGMDSSMVQNLVITATDSSDNDLYQGKLIEHGMPCPSMCSTANPLNS